MSDVSLTDIDSIIQAAEKEALLMTDYKQETPTASEVLSDSLKDNTVELGNPIDQDMMEEARKLLSSGQTETIMKEMEKRGINPRAMKSQMLKQQRSLKGLDGKNTDTKECILIKTNRQLKTRNIKSGCEQGVAHTIIRSGTPVELSCSRLALGPLTGKTIKVWCNPEMKGTNKRLSKILGFPIGGEGLFVLTDGDLTEKDFNEAEKLLI